MPFVVLVANATTLGACTAGTTTSARSARPALTAASSRTAGTTVPAQGGARGGRTTALRARPV